MRCKFSIEVSKNAFYFYTAALTYFFSPTSRIPGLHCAFQTKPGSSSFAHPAGREHRLLWLMLLTNTCYVQRLDSLPAQLIPP